MSTYRLGGIYEGMLAHGEPSHVLCLHADGLATFGWTRPTDRDAMIQSVMAIPCKIRPVYDASVGGYVEPVPTYWGRVQAERAVDACYPELRPDVSQDAA